MNQILYYVNQLYYDSVDMESLMDGAFKGIMDQLDPHSVFISAKDQKNIVKNQHIAYDKSMIYLEQDSDLIYPDLRNSAI